MVKLVSPPGAENRPGQAAHRRDGQLGPGDREGVDEIEEAEAVVRGPTARQRREWQPPRGEPVHEVAAEGTHHLALCGTGDGKPDQSMRLASEPLGSHSPTARLIARSESTAKRR